MQAPSPPTTPELLKKSAHQLSQAIHAKEVSCVALMQATLLHIAKHNPTYNAIVQLVDEQSLLGKAAAHDVMLAKGQSMGWLHGLPQAIKDLSHCQGFATVSGSPLLKNFYPQEDGLMVSRLRAAGAIFIGKTNVPEFGLGSHTFNEVYGATRNAFDTSKSAGGSSGGAAVALATHMLCVADGSDYMGSLRNPAAWNGIWGMRPSQGRVPMWPALDVWTSLMGTEGPMARSVTDLCLMLQTQAGFDKRTPLSIAGNFQAWEQLDALTPNSAIKIARLGNLGGHLQMEPGIMEMCDAALIAMQQAGCSVADAHLDISLNSVWNAWLIWRQALIGARIAPLLDSNPDKNRSLIKPEALWEHDQSRHLTGTQFMQASTMRSSYYQAIVRLFDDFDFLALPCSQVWPFDALDRYPTHINGVEMDTYHRWMESSLYATFAGLPCVSIPVGCNADGLHTGLQLIGKPQDDLGVLQIARFFERFAM